MRVQVDHPGTSAMPVLPLRLPLPVLFEADSGQAPLYRSDAPDYMALSHDNHSSIIANQTRHY
jgi:hypothetical protein